MLPATDATRIRTVIESIRTALPRSQRFSLNDGLTIGVEMDALAQQLGHLIGVAKSTDMAALLRMESPSPADPALASRLATALYQLRLELLRDLTKSLGGDAGVSAVGVILHEPVPDFLTMLGLAQNENAHSSVIRWLLDPETAPTVAPRLIGRLVEGLPDASVWLERVAAGAGKGGISVRREVLVGRETAETDATDRLDILVSGSNFALAIENKIWSVEHDDQTRTYWQWLQHLPKGILRAGIFLSPNGHPASAAGFRPLSYTEFLGMLQQVHQCGLGSAQERTVLAGYIKALATAVLKLQINALKAR